MRKAQIAIVMWLLSASSRAGTVYFKDLIFEGVDLDAKINAGALLQTWSGPTLVQTTLDVKLGAVPPVNINYSHATTLTNEKKINGGLPMSFTGRTLTSAQCSCYVEGPEFIVDAHLAPNAAVLTEMAVYQRNYNAITVWDSNTNKYVRRPLSEDVEDARATLQGSASAGTPADGHKYHSANSFAAVELDPTAKKVWQGEGTSFKVYTKNVLTGTASSGDVFGAGIDPVFLTVTSDDLLFTQTEELMSEVYTYHNGHLELNDNFFRLVIPLNDPTAFASLAFTSVSPWVSNPYSYMVQLDALGLRVLGDRFPLAGWTVTTTATTMEAFFALGSDGLGYDAIEVALPGSLMSEGTAYSVAFGLSNGAYEVASVPEPTTLLLCGAGLAVIILTQRKQRP